MSAPSPDAASLSDRDFIEAVRQSQNWILAEWSDESEADVTVAILLRLCDLAEKGLSDA